MKKTSWVINSVVSLVSQISSHFSPWTSTGEILTASQGTPWIPSSHVYCKQQKREVSQSASPEMMVSMRAVRLPPQSLHRWGRECPHAQLCSCKHNPAPPAPQPAGTATLQARNCSSSAMSQGLHFMAPNRKCQNQARKTQENCIFMYVLMNSATASLWPVMGKETNWSLYRQNTKIHSPTLQLTTCLEKRRQSWPFKNL